MLIIDFSVRTTLLTILDFRLFSLQIARRGQAINHCVLLKYVQILVKNKFPSMQPNARSMIRLLVCNEIIATCIVFFTHTKFAVLSLFLIILRTTIVLNWQKLFRQLQFYAMGKALTKYSNIKSWNVLLTLSFRLQFSVVQNSFYAYCA